MRTLAVRCPDWPVIAAWIIDGVPAHAPVAVLYANRVLACSPAARAEGVTRGLRKREAQGRCPELVVVETDPARDARAFEPVVVAIEQVAAGVEVISPGACAAAARGPARYFGGEEAAAERVVEQVAQECGVEARVGIADGAFAAGQAARAGRIVPPGQSRQFLAGLDIGVLDSGELDGGAPVTGARAGGVRRGGVRGSGIRSSGVRGSGVRGSGAGGSGGRTGLVSLLRRLGVRTLGDFAALPAGDVLARFGFDAALAHRLAAGGDERPLAVRRPPPELTVVEEYEEPLDRVDTAAFAARALAERLHERLAAHGLACTRLGIEAVTAHGQQWHRTWRHDGLLSAAAITDRVRWQLEGWLTPGRGGAAGASASPAGAPTAGIRWLRLTPEGVLTQLAQQPGLWGQANAGRARADRALARVQGLLGPEAVLGAVLRGGRSPADQVHLIPWGDERVEDTPAPWPGQLPPPAPATVLPEPEPVTVHDVQGRPVAVDARLALSAAPARLRIGKQSAAEVTGWAGPWPVDERWWAPGEARRVARFQVALADGRALLLALSDGAWWVEAVYD